MKIPDAYFTGGFGQKIAQPQQAVMPDASSAMRIGAAAERIGHVALDAAVNQIDEAGRLQLEAATARQNEEIQRQREADHALKELEKAKEHGEAQGALFAHQNTLNDLAGEIGAKADLTPQQKQDLFKEQSDLTRANFLASVPEKYQYAFTPAFDQHLYQARTKLDNSIASDMQTTIKAQLINTVEEIKRSPRPLNEKLQLVADLNWADAGFDDARKAQEVQKIREEVTSNEVAARFNREDPRQILKDLTGTQQDGAFSNYSYLEPKTREALIHTAKSRIEQLDREAEAERNRRKHERNEAAKSAYEDYKDARQGLLTLDPKKEAAMWRAMQGTPYFDKARDVRRNTGGLDFLTKKISEDPLKYGGAQLGIVIPALDASRPDTWAGQLKARGEVAGQVKGKYGLSYLPVLTNDEAKGLTEYLNTQTAAGTVRTLEAFTSQLGSKSAGRIAQQFASSNPELGTVAGLVALGKPEAATLVAQGHRLVKEKAINVEAGMKKDMQAKFDSIMGEALSGMPQARAAFFDAAKLAYIAKATEKGVWDKDFDKSVFAEVVKEVAGETTKINGKRVLLPTGMPESTFKDYFKRIDAKQVEQAGGVFGYSDPAAAANAIRGGTFFGGAKLMEAGEGRYRFTIDGKPLRTADNKRDFILEIGVHGGY